MPALWLWFPLCRTGARFVGPFRMIGVFVEGTKGVSKSGTRRDWAGAADQPGPRTAATFGHRDVALNGTCTAVGCVIHCVQFSAVWYNRLPRATAFSIREAKRRFGGLVLKFDRISSSQNC